MLLPRLGKHWFLDLYYLVIDSISKTKSGRKIQKVGRQKAGRGDRKECRLKVPNHTLKYA